MDNSAVEIPLSIINEPAVHVDGPRAFVLYQREIGRIEIGSPFPHDDVWQHFSGDLMATAVSANDGLTSGGGGTWDGEELGALVSHPGSGDDVTAGGWVVIERIPEKWTRVLVRFGEQRLTQSPIRGIAAIPLQPGNGDVVEVLGIDNAGTETHLTDFDLA